MIEFYCGVIIVYSLSCDENQKMRNKTLKQKKLDDKSKKFLNQLFRNK